MSLMTWQSKANGSNHLMVGGKVFAVVAVDTSDTTKFKTRTAFGDSTTHRTAEEATSWAETYLTDWLEEAGLYYRVQDDEPDHTPFTAEDDEPFVGYNDEY